MDMEKGEILARGMTAKKFLNSRKGQRNAFLNAVFLTSLGFCISAYFLWMKGWEIKNLTTTDRLEIFILTALSLISSLGIWAYWPSSWDRLNIIYENGLSATDAPFLPFSEVKVIGEGRVPERNDKSRFIVAVSKDRNWKHNVIYEEADFVNDFYEEARHLLKQKCPEVPWVKMEWLEWKKKRR